jgi:hypothetical protein
VPTLENGELKNDSPNVLNGNVPTLENPNG